MNLRIRKQLKSPQTLTNPTNLTTLTLNLGVTPMTKTPMTTTNLQATHALTQTYGVHKILNLMVVPAHQAHHQYQA
jgi:hypothetical protein